MNNTEQILHDIAESWGFDSFDEWTSDMISLTAVKTEKEIADKIKNLVGDAIEMHVSQNHLST